MTVTKISCSPCCLFHSSLSLNNVAHAADTSTGDCSSDIPDLQVADVYQSWLKVEPCVYSRCITLFTIFN